VLQGGTQRCLGFVQPVEQRALSRESFMEASQAGPVSSVGVTQRPLVLRGCLAVGTQCRRPAGRIRGMAPDRSDVAGAFSVVGQHSRVGLANVPKHREQPCVQLTLAMRSDR
jgi:hypothetical protein